MADDITLRLQDHNCAERTAKIAHIQMDFDIVDASIAMLALTLSAVGAGCTRLWVDQPKTETALGTA